MIIEDTINNAAKILKDKDIKSYNLDAQIILSDVMKVSKEFLLLNSRGALSKKDLIKYDHAIKRRIKKEPVAYIIGKKEFWSHDFEVNKDTLIPRPETELLIYKIINHFKNRKINILDKGTGSGCILLALLKELKHSCGIGIDISSKAIQIAKKNCHKLNLYSRAKFKVFDINKFQIGKYDLIVSNSPYIPIKDIKNLSQDIRNYEPRVALNGGIDGLDLIKKVIYKSVNLLKNNGLLAIEIGNNQYLKVSNFLKKNNFREISKEYDYKGNVRCIITTKI